MQPKKKKFLINEHLLHLNMEQKPENLPTPNNTAQSNPIQFFFFLITFPFLQNFDEDEHENESRDLLRMWQIPEDLTIVSLQR